MYKNFFVVLGAPDPEMKEIQRICLEEKIKFAYATIDGRVVKPFQAYSANGLLKHATGTPRAIPAGSVVVTVECEVENVNPNFKIDHHREGDAGFGKAPENYLEGSSLGQFLKLLNKEPTPRQKVIAAADHCLTSAYQGLCPGVSVEDLAMFRESSRSEAKGISVDCLKSQIVAAIAALKESPTISIAGKKVAFMENPPPEVAEASARISYPYVYIRTEQDGRIKSGVRSAPADVVAEFIENCDLSNIYGDPMRGFAGGYFRQAQ